MQHALLTWSRRSRALALLALLAVFSAPLLEAAHGHDSVDTAQHCLLCQTSTDSTAAEIGGLLPDTSRGTAFFANKPTSSATTPSHHHFARGPPRNT